MKLQRTTSQFIIVKSSLIHGRGVFAKKDIPKGTKIVEYVGKKITKKQAEELVAISIARHKKIRSVGAVYIFELNKKFDIDGDVPYNAARHINHSCDPNCEVDIICGKIWIIALKDIAQGEEIFYNYGYDYEGFEDHPCHCGTNRCVGYIMAEEHWPKLKK
jgi:SET domain-containing protein